MRDGEDRVSGRECRIELDGTLQQFLRLEVCRLRLQPPLLPAPQIAVIGFWVAGALVGQLLLLALSQVERQRADDLLRHVVLNGEDVGEVAVEALRP